MSRLLFRGAVFQCGGVNVLMIPPVCFEALFRAEMERTAADPGAQRAVGRDISVTAGAFDHFSSRADCPGRSYAAILLDGLPENTIHQSSDVFEKRPVHSGQPSTPRIIALSSVDNLPIISIVVMFNRG